VGLTLNAPTRIEGYWARCLYDADARPLFNLSFGFTAADTLLIASLQGLKRADGSNRETIRALNKQCHGLRPRPADVATGGQAERAAVVRVSVEVNLRRPGP